MSRRKEPSIPNDILDQLLAGTDAAAALSQGGLLDFLKKAFAERALNAEMDHHLGQEDQGANSRNGYRSEEHTSELQSLMRISYAVFCLKKKTKTHRYKLLNTNI